MNAVNRITTASLKFIVQFYSTKKSEKSVLLNLSKVLIFTTFSKRYQRSKFHYTHFNFLKDQRINNINLVTEFISEHNFM